MFYERFIKLCEERKEKPTSLLRRFGYSTGNLKKWREGASVNSRILVTLCNYFEVSMNYFFIDELKEECLRGEIDDEE